MEDTIQESLRDQLQITNSKNQTGWAAIEFNKLLKIKTASHLYTKLNQIRS
jgi:hypothetical protein